MKNLHILTTSIAATAAFTQRISAETLLVPEQYPTIQEAVNAVNQDGDIIEVSPGVYLGFDASQVNFSFEVRSTDGGENTFLDIGDSPTNVPIISVPYQSARTVVIDGFTFKDLLFSANDSDEALVVAPGGELRNLVFDNCDDDGSEPSYYGALMGPGDYYDCSALGCDTKFLVFSTDQSGGPDFFLDLTSCTFDSCTATSSLMMRVPMTDVSIRNCSSGTIIFRPNIIRECEFIGCTSTNVLYFVNSYDANVQDCKFESNSGRCIYMGSGSNSGGTIVGCNFEGNYGPESGTAIYSEANLQLFVTNCSFTNNSATVIGSAIYDSSDAGTVICTGTTACNNSPNNFFGSVNTSDPSNNISVNCEEEVSCCLPGSCLVLPTSTCADAGGISLTGDCNQEDCPNEGACCIDGDCVFTTLETCFDLGGNYAGFGTDCASTICESTCEGDISGNGDVGLTDLIAVLSNWGPCP